MSYDEQAKDYINYSDRADFAYPAVPYAIIAVAYALLEIAQQLSKLVTKANDG